MTGTLEIHTGYLRERGMEGGRETEGENEKMREGEGVERGSVDLVLLAWYF